MSEHRDIWIFSDKQDLMLEMLGIGRELADKLGSELVAVSLGSNITDGANEFIRYGADKVYVADDPSLEHFQLDACLAILHDLLIKYMPESMIIGSTRNGKPLAARLATRLGVGCVPDCNRITMDENSGLVGERMTYGGNAIAKMTFRKKPYILTVPSKAFEKPKPSERNGQVINVDVKATGSATEVVERRPLETSNVRIEEADVVIGCGRGLEKKEDRSLLDAISTVLCGQVGCSRPLAEDRKWFSEWVGLSGHKVRPSLYIACGISGVIQHVAGIRDAKVIVAINKDPEAPIFEVADYGVVGDLYQVLPALKEALEKRKH